MVDHTEKYKISQLELIIFSTNFNFQLRLMGYRLSRYWRFYEFTPSFFKFDIFKIIINDINEAKFTVLEKKIQFGSEKFLSRFQIY